MSKPIVKKIHLTDDEKNELIKNFYNTVYDKFDNPNKIKKEFSNKIKDVIRNEIIESFNDKDFLEAHIKDLTEKKYKNIFENIKDRIKNKLKKHVVENFLEYDNFGKLPVTILTDKLPYQILGFEDKESGNDYRKRLNELNEEQLLLLIGFLIKYCSARDNENSEEDILNKIEKNNEKYVYEFLEQMASDLSFSKEEEEFIDSCFYSMIKQTNTEGLYDKAQRLKGEKDLEKEIYPTEDLEELKEEEEKLKEFEKEYEKNLEELEKEKIYSKEDLESLKILGELEKELRLRKKEVIDKIKNKIKEELKKAEEKYPIVIEYDDPEIDVVHESVSFKIICENYYINISLWENTPKTNNKPAPYGTKYAVKPIEHNKNTAIFEVEYEFLTDQHEILKLPNTKQTNGFLPPNSSVLMRENKNQYVKTERISVYKAKYSLAVCVQKVLNKLHESNLI